MSAGRSSLPLRAPLPSSGGRPYTLCPDDQGSLLDDVWPTLFFGRERVAELRRKIADLPWARALWHQMLVAAEAALREEPSQPIERAGWRHDFYSHATGEHLLYDPTNPHAFLDPRTGGSEQSAAQHRAWVLLTHERTHRLMRSLALMYAVSGDERYAAWVRQGLLRAVDYFQHDEFRRGNRAEALYFQPLYDGPVLLQLAISYDLTRNAGVYQPADHPRITQGIFERGMPYQLRFLDEIGVHNMGCFVSAAVAVCGHLLQKPEWIERGLRHPQAGLRAQVLRGFPAGADGQIDGFWYEGTIFYHFYSLCPLLSLLELARALHDPLATDPAVLGGLSAGLMAPVQIADAQDRVPPLGDLGNPQIMSLGVYRHLYEYAAGRLDAERFGPVLARLTQRAGERDGWSALAFGPDALPSPAPPTRDHTLLARPGVAVFRDAGSGLYCLFKAGPHGAGHDHRDKLELVLHGGGEVIAPDLGTAGYALTRVHPYYRGTFSHNTLMVDGRNQAEVKSAHLIWQPGARPAYAHGTVSDAYPGVYLSRQVWFDPPYVVILDEAAGDREHEFDWVFHALGSLQAGVSEAGTAPDLKPLPTNGPWALFTARRSAALPAGAQFEACWRVRPGVQLRLLLTTDGPAEAVTGRTAGQPIPDDRGTVLIRALGKRRRFAAVFEVHRGRSTAGAVSLGSDHVLLGLPSGPRRYAVPPSGNLGK